jgi:hypothetical protein
MWLGAIVAGYRGKVRCRNQNALLCSSEKRQIEQHLQRFGEADTRSPITSQSTQRISYSPCSANGLIPPKRLEPCKWRNLWQSRRWQRWTMHEKVRTDRDTGVGKDSDHPSIGDRRLQRSGRGRDRPHRPGTSTRDHRTMDASLVYRFGLQAAKAATGSSVAAAE